MGKTKKQIKTTNVMKKVKYSKINTQIDKLLSLMYFPLESNKKKGDVILNACNTAF